MPNSENIPLSDTSSQLGSETIRHSNPPSHHSETIVVDPASLVDAKLPDRLMASSSPTLPAHPPAASTYSGANITSSPTSQNNGCCAPCETCFSSFAQCFRIVCNAIVTVCSPYKQKENDSRLPLMP